jgi:hypothetical protein
LRGPGIFLSLELELDETPGGRRGRPSSLLLPVIFLGLLLLLDDRQLLLLVGLDLALGLGPGLPFGLDLGPTLGLGLDLGMASREFF